MNQKYLLLAFFILIHMQLQYCSHIKEESYCKKSVNTDIYKLGKHDSSFKNIKFPRGNYQTNTVPRHEHSIVFIVNH